MNALDLIPRYATAADALLGEALVIEHLRQLAWLAGEHFTGYDVAEAMEATLSAASVRAVRRAAQSRTTVDLAGLTLSDVVAVVAAAETLSLSHSEAVAVHLAHRAERLEQVQEA